MIKLSRRTKVVTAVIAGSLLLTGVILPLLWPDNTSEYSGVKRDAAEHAPGAAWSLHNGLDYLSVTGSFRARVQSVSLDSNNSRCTDEFYSLKEPEQGNNFLVIVSFRTFFGIEVGQSWVHSCRLQKTTPR